MPKEPNESAVPRYSEIRDVLLGEIQAGVYKVGGRLPGEHELCERFDVSRFTIRQALQGLRDEGLVEARPGIGTIVVSDRRREAFVQTLGSFEELLQYPAETFRKQLEVQTIEASPELALMLRSSPGQRWVKLKAMRIARASGQPISWLDAYVTPRFADVIDLPNPGGTPLLRQIEARHGHRAAHAQVEIFVGRIPAHLAGPLDAEEGAPALIILRRYRGADGAVYLVTYSVHPENRFSLNIELERQ
jgi:DNA-binding GntR family transcriptional regulator